MNFEYNEKLWIKFKDDPCEGQHFIIGNPHTFTGRVMAYCNNKDSSFFFSLNEVSEMSVESEYWLKGYLSGSEPEPPTDSEGDVDFQSESYNHWSKSIDKYHITGCWYKGNRECEICGRLLLNSDIGLVCENCTK